MEGNRSVGKKGGGKELGKGSSSTSQMLSSWVSMVASFKSDASEIWYVPASLIT